MEITRKELKTILGELNKNNNKTKNLFANSDFNKGLHLGFKGGIELKRSKKIRF